MQRVEYTSALTTFRRRKSLTNGSNRTVSVLDFTVYTFGLDADLNGRTTMTTKIAIIATLAIGPGAIVLGPAVLFLVAGGRKAKSLGKGFAMLALIPIGGIWIM
jgi:hypothetical protein